MLCWERRLDVRSIFSPASLASSVTSAGIALLPDETINYFVDLLHAAAVQEEAIGVDRLQRNLRRLISDYGRSLRLDAKADTGYVAAKLLQSRNVSAPVARAIVDKTEQSEERHRNLRTPSARLVCIALNKSSLVPGPVTWDSNAVLALCPSLLTWNSC